MHREAPADHVDAAGAAGAGCEANGKPTGLRSLSARRSYTRRLTRQDLEFALQMFENASLSITTSRSRTLHIANASAQYHNLYEARCKWIDRPRPRASAPRAWKGCAGSARRRSVGFHMKEQYEESVRRVRQAIDRKPTPKALTTCSAAPCLPVVAIRKSWDMTDDAIAHSGDNYNIYVPIRQSPRRAWQEHRQRAATAGAGSRTRS